MIGRKVLHFRCSETLGRNFFLFGSKHCSHNMIPEGGAHTITFVWIYIMVPHVMIFEGRPITIVHFKMVDGIMTDIVKQISDHKTGIER